jgi:DNA-binding Lrp family transcriptional regulator
MVGIDLKDRKILYELDLDARQSLTQIGKKVGLKKDVVSYRIKKMQDEGVIKNFWTAINTMKLGYNVFRAYINFQDVSPSLKKEIIEHFNTHKNVWAILSVQGPIDFDVIYWVNDTYEFNQFWIKTLGKYGRFFSNYTFSLFTHGIACKKSYLLTNDILETDNKHYTFSSIGKSVNIDKIDFEILNEIALNARIPLIELAQKLNCSSQTINYRLKNLIKTGVIQAFRVEVDLSKLGLINCSLDLYLNDHTKREKIIQYLNRRPDVEYILDGLIGWCDLSIEVMVENIDKLTKLIEELDNKFPTVIRKHNIWISKQVHKERWLPELY